jgi:hypothetical protein
MHTAQRSPFAIKRNTALHESGIQAIVFELALAPGAREEPSFIGFGFDVNLEGSL